MISRQFLLEYTSDLAPSFLVDNIGNDQRGQRSKLGVPLVFNDLVLQLAVILPSLFKLISDLVEVALFLGGFMSR